MRNREIDAEGRETKFEYDSLGRRTKRILPGGQQETFAYDAVGSLINRTDFNGNTTTFAYDVMNRLLLETPDAAAFPGTAAITFTYTDNGQRATMSDANGLTTFTYDERDRLLTKATPDGTLTYTYDAAGNLLSTTSSNVNGVAVSYQYDVLNRLSAAGDENFTPPATHTYGYDDVGNLENLEYANGVTHFWSYDDRNRLDNLVVTDVSDIAIASFNYALDLVGNRTQMAELSGRVVDYTYDKLYRLTDEVIGGGAGPTGAVNYQYDAVGNRLSRTSTLTGQTNQSFGYDANDRILTDTFDDNGNTIGSSGNTDEYDFKNRLIRRTKADSTIIDITYDGVGNRVAKTVTPLSGPSATTNYLVDTNNLTGFAQVVEEIESGAVIRVYTYGLDLISIDQDVGGLFEISYYIYDGLGSVRGLTDLNSNLTDTYTYDAFGNPLTTTGLTPNNYRFTGEQLDPNLGLYFLRARYLNTQTGRFHTLDSFEGSNQEPFSLHKYLYANTNPVINIDPSGNITLGNVLSALKIGTSFFRILFSPLSKLASRTIIAAESQAIRLQYAQFYLLPTAAAVKEFANSQWARRFSHRSAWSNANRLFNIAHSLEQAYLGHLRGATVGFSASVALGPLGLLFNSLNAGIGVVQVFKDLSDQTDEILKIAKIVEQIGFELSSEGTRLLLGDAALYKIYPSEYVDVVRDIVEGNQDGNHAIVKHNTAFLKSLVGRYNSK